MEPFGNSWGQTAQLTAAIVNQWAKEPLADDLFLPPGAYRASAELPPEQSDDEIAEVLMQLVKGTP